MYQAKIRILAGVGGVFFGFVGIAMLSVALFLALVPLMGAALAAAAVAFVWLFAASVCVYFATRSPREDEFGLDALQTAASEKLADIPSKAFEKIVQRHPLKAAGFALVLGYSLVADPTKKNHMIQTLLMRYI
jgi:membrane protein implicated in regulation of membrane protease activity